MHARAPDVRAAAADVTALPFHESATLHIAAPRHQVFAFIDDPARLAGHMAKRSWRMGGGSMHVEVDELRGKGVGSHTRLQGRAFGVPIDVDTQVVERTPPARKAWRTLATPRLLVIGPYRMGADLADLGGASRITIAIDYALPGGRRGVIARWLARGYARWCVRTMVHDIALAFAPRRASRGV
jgi:hypothetical protein